MSVRHDDTDGSEIFWPGYVDATTNLILNLLFLLTILIVAVFMFALELGRSTQAHTVDQPLPSQENKGGNFEMVIKEQAQKNEHLEREIHRLKALLAQRPKVQKQPGGKKATLDATTATHKPDRGLAKMQAHNFEVIVNFSNGAISFNAVEKSRLLDELRPVVQAEKTNIDVEVPAGFSEAKRLGFYRAMAVRNLLIEMNVARDNIEVSVVERNKEANASLVRVRSR